jgi:chaperone modulatory protein CbpM
MAETTRPAVHGVIVEEETGLTLEALCRACHADMAELVALVDEGVLLPAGSVPQEWRFAGPSLARARAALRLSHDFELGVAATALVLELLDEIEVLRSRMRRAGVR